METCEFLASSLSMKQKNETIYAMTNLPQEGAKARKINRSFDKLSRRDSTPEEIYQNLEKIKLLVNKIEGEDVDVRRTREEERLRKKGERV